MIIARKKKVSFIQAYVIKKDDNNDITFCSVPTPHNTLGKTVCWGYADDTDLTSQWGYLLFLGGNL